jgi:hypothetical protein
MKPSVPFFSLYCLFTGHFYFTTVGEVPDASAAVVQPWYFEQIYFFWNICTVFFFLSTSIVIYFKLFGLHALSYTCKRRCIYLRLCACPCVHLSRKHQLGSRWANFLEIWYLGNYNENLFSKNPKLVKIGNTHLAPYMEIEVCFSRFLRHKVAIKHC